MNAHIVVSKYKEDMDWVRVLWMPTFIYDRAPNVPTPSNPHITKFVLKNNELGREADTFLRYIIDFYDCLPDVVFFLQGFPFHHYPYLYRALGAIYNETVGLSLYNPQHPLAHAPEDGIAFSHDASVFTILGTKPIASQNKSAFQYQWSLLSRWNRLFPGYDPPERLVFSAGAQMAVPRHRILQKPLFFYKSIYQDIQQNSLEQDAWTLELFWLYIFGEVDPTKFPGSTHQLTLQNSTSKLTGKIWA